MTHTACIIVTVFCLICVPAAVFCVDRLKRMSMSNPFLAGSSPSMDDKDRGAAASLFQKRDQMFDRLKERFLEQQKQDRTENTTL